MSLLRKTTTNCKTPTNVFLVSEIQAQERAKQIDYHGSCTRDIGFSMTCLNNCIVDSEFVQAIRRHMAESKKESGEMVSSLVS